MSPAKLAEGEVAKVGRRYSRRDDPEGEREVLEVEEVGPVEGGRGDIGVRGTIVFPGPAEFAAQGTGERFPYGCSHEVFPKAWGHDLGPVG